MQLVWAIGATHRDAQPGYLRWFVVPPALPCPGRELTGWETLLVFGGDGRHGVLHDTSALGGQASLRLLSLYGLPEVRSLPSLAGLVHLKRLEIGSMKGLSGLGPLLDAPRLQELLLIREVALSSTDPAAIAAHPTIRAFEWFAEDVPDKTWVPVVDQVRRPKVKPMEASAWFARNP